MSFVYERVLRPLLFLLPPETAHHLGVWGLKFWPGSAPTHDPRLAVTVGKGPDALSFPSPLGLAAGFDKDATAVAGVEALGFGFLEVGTVTPRPQPGNPRPRLFRYPGLRALINRLGFNNAGAEAMKRRLAGASHQIPRGINLGKNKDTPNDLAVEDYRRGLTLLFDEADFFVINVSSPNTPGLRDLQSAASLGPLLKTLKDDRDRLAREKNRTRRPLMFVKVSPDEGLENEFVETVVEAGFDGIVATNTTRDRAGFPADAPADGGASGAIVREKSTAVLRRLAQAARGRLILIGVGGIFTAEDVLEKREAGASLVELYTGFVYGGPGLIKNIEEDLLSLMNKKSIPIFDSRSAS